MTRARRIATIAASALLGLVPAAGAQQAGDPEPEAVPGEFVVAFAPGTPGAERGKAVKDHGGTVVTEIPALNAVAMAFEDLKSKKDKAADKAKAGKLKQDKRFASVEPNLIYRATYTPNDPSFGLQWAWNRIAAPAAWDVTQGSSSTTIAVIDTGRAAHASRPGREDRSGLRLGAGRHRARRRPRPRHPRRRHRGGRDRQRHRRGRHVPELPGHAAARS